MPESYPRDLASHVRRLLSRKLGASCPTTAVLQQMFERLYFASLKQEEAESVSCRVAFMDRANPDPKPPQRIVKNRWKYYPLAQDLPFSVRNLVKLSKAVDPWSSTLAVDVDSKGELRIWGLVDQGVHYSTFVMQESDSGPQTPGLFQAVIEGIGEIGVYSRYTFLGRLRQDVLVTRQLNVLYDGPVCEKLTPALQRFQLNVKTEVGEVEFARRDHWEASLRFDWISALSRILIGIQRYGHGGAVLLSNVQEGLNARYTLRYPRLAAALHCGGVLSVRRAGYSDRIREDHLGKNGGTVGNSVPAPLYLGERVSEHQIDETENEITGCVRFLSSLSRVDGLIWMSHDLALEGFGVLIGTEEEPEKVFRANDAAGASLTEIDIHNFGTRHRSMMRQCWRDPQSVGFVVSQDGDVRAITNHDGKILIWESIRLQRFTNSRFIKRDKAGDHL